MGNLQKARLDRIKLGSLAKKTEQSAIEKAETHSEITWLINDMHMQHRNLMAIGYEPLNITNPFVFKSKFSFMPVIAYQPQLNNYMVNLRPFSKVLPVPGADLLKIADDIKIISRLCLKINALYDIHKTLIK